MLKKSDISPSFLVFALTVLASVGFFNFHGILKENIIKLILFIFIGASTFMAYMNGRSLRGLHYHAHIYILMLAGICFSALMAYTQHDQPLTTSVIAVLPFFATYAYFFVAMKFDFDPDRIMRMYTTLAVASAVVYFINVMTMPNNAFGKPILGEDLSRGILRIPLTFIEIFPLIVFYAINKLIDTKKKIWLLPLAFASLMIFLSVVRQIIAFTAVLGFLFYFRKISIFKKLIFIVAALTIVVYVLPMIPMYRTMIELSEDQRDENEEEENIRIQAWRFYTYENQENALTAIFGNGVPSAGNSTWGIIFDSEAEVSGKFTHDVGWAGFYFFFGIISTVALLMVIFYAIFKPKLPQYQFINYWLIMILLTCSISGINLYSFQVLNVSIVLAMVYYSGNNTLGIKPQSEETTETHPQTPRLIPKYPQLSD